VAKKKLNLTADRYWLLKSEPESYSIDDLEKDGRTGWDGVRNYQARNIMRDDMKVGHLALFYHSSSEPPGVAGVARICGLARPDETAWEKGNHHFDPKASPENPIWLQVDVEFVAKFANYIPLDELKASRELDGIMVCKRGSRLSVQPVDAPHFEAICKMGGLT
jgi:predicted RNA-binding protein with PUA-like domain